MKALICTILLSLTFGTACDSTPAAEEIPEPGPRDKAAILTYLNDLIANEQVLTGQHCGDGIAQVSDFYNLYVEPLAAETGKYVGLLGADLGYVASASFDVSPLVDFWNQGGLVTISWHADNPWLPGFTFRWNSVDNKDTIDLTSLTKSAPDSEARTSYRAELAGIAGALQQLKDAGVTVIWRPFHEMNGDWFWWGMDAYNNQQTNEADFITFYRDLHDTLTNDYGLDNLIWTYSPNRRFDWNADVTAYYPGDAYVDVVGQDYYGISPDFPDFDALFNLGKPLVMAEGGPIDGSYGTWDEMALVNLLKGKAAYFLQWHSWPGADVAIKDNLNANEMMNSDVAITRDEISLGATRDVNAKLVLQGAFNGDGMDTSLNDEIPLNQPFGAAPFDYDGEESVATVPDDVVDWVLLELRPEAGGEICRRAALLRSDGSIVDLDGASAVRYPGVVSGAYSLVVRHRNHLAVQGGVVQIGPAGVVNR